MRLRLRLARAGLLLGLLMALGAQAPPARAELVNAIKVVKPSIVAIGTFLATRRPPAVFLATGFAVGNGNQIITNSHAVPELTKLKDKERLAVYTGKGKAIERRYAKLIARDDVHDLALLQIEGPSLATLKLRRSGTLSEGESIAFTGFPIGMVLGLYPATHRGIISAITPVVLPQIRTRDLSAKMVRMLREPYDVYQLDATAYPGNSGSPVYRVSDGEVVGVVNKVFVKSIKENVLKDPSGITYAIPIRYAIELLEKH